MNLATLKNGCSGAVYSGVKQDDKAVCVLIAEPDPRVRTALRLFLRAMPEVACVEEEQDIVDLVPTIKWLHPDVLLLDWSLASHHASALLLLLRVLEPRLKRIVALSLSAEDRTSSLAAGSDAFVLMGDPPEELARAVRFGGSTEVPGPGDPQENAKPLFESSSESSIESAIGREQHEEGEGE